MGILVIFTSCHSITVIQSRNHELCATKAYHEQETQIPPQQMSATNSLPRILVDSIKDIPESMVLTCLVLHSTT